MALQLPGRSLFALHDRLGALERGGAWRGAAAGAVSLRRAARTALLRAERLEGQPMVTALRGLPALGAQELHLLRRREHAPLLSVLHEERPQSLTLRQNLGSTAFSLHRPLRPGLAALLYAGALIAMGVAEVLRAPRLEDGCTIGGFDATGPWWEGHVHRPRPALPKGTWSGPGLLCRLWWDSEIFIPYDLLKVATLHVVSALLFRHSRAAKLVCLASASVPVAFGLALTPERERSSWPEGLLLYLVISAIVLLVGQETSRGCGLGAAMQANSGFESMSQVVLRQRMLRQLRDVTAQAPNVYELSHDETQCLVQVLGYLHLAMEKLVVSEVPTLDVRASPPMVQEKRGARGKGRRRETPCNLHEVRQQEATSVDVKKAQRKYVQGKFQSSGSSKSIGVVDPIPEHADMSRNKEPERSFFEEEDFTYPATINAMMYALTFSSGQGTPSLVPEDGVCVLMAQFGSWDFNVVGFAEVLGGQTLRSMGTKALTPYAERLFVPIGRVHGAGQWVRMGGVLRNELATVENVLQSLEGRYHRSNPYHNSVHAADVVNSCAYFLSYFNKSGDQFSDRELFAALLSAAAHDVGHDGKSGRYHTTTESPLALMYNDSSVLEMMHYLAKHFEQVKKFREKYLESEAEDILSFMLKLSDIGGIAKPFQLHAYWATRIQSEFFLQGDVEREVGLPCSPFCDRQVQKVAESQQGFYTYIVKPLYDCVMPFVHSPRVELEVIHNITENEGFWARYDNTRFNYQDPIACTGDLVKQFRYRPNRAGSDPLQETTLRLPPLSLTRNNSRRGDLREAGPAVPICHRWGFSPRKDAMESSVRTKLLAGAAQVCIQTSVGILYKVSQAATGGFKYSTTSAICMAEFVKLLMSASFHVLASWLSVGEYMINNQLSFYIYTLVDPGTVFLFKAASTMIVATVQCTFAGKKFSWEQWKAMMLQACGMITVQYDPCKGAGVYSVMAYTLLCLSTAITAVSAARNELLDDGVPRAAEERRKVQNGGGDGVERHSEWWLF
eukprot:g13737.t1